jgi:hypothetical protein
MPRIISGMARIRLHLCLLLLTTLAAAAQTPPVQSTPAQSNSAWTLQSSHTTASLRGIHAVNSRIAWASGTGGTILRTLDGGRHWRPCATPPNAAKLDFRAVWAFDARTAWAMSSGPGNLSRLYKTTDGCEHWTLLVTNQAPNGFWDAMQFFDKDWGYILGDPVDGSFVLLNTIDGGKTWERVYKRRLSAPSGSGVFAASNSSLDMNPVAPCYFGSGGTAGAFVHFTRPWDKKVKWYKSAVPLDSGSSSSGVFAVAVGKARYVGSSPYRLKNVRLIQHVIAVGGDYTQPNNPTGTAAWSTDGGLHWHAATHPPHGYRSTVAWDAQNHAWITAGTNGSDISFDNGRTWQPLGNGNWNAISLPFIVGPKGRIGRLNPARLPK